MATQAGGRWEMDARELLPGDLLRCAASTNYVLIVTASREGDDIMVTIAGSSAAAGTPSRIPVGRHVQVSRRACFGPMTATERYTALRAWYIATGGYCIGRDAYWPSGLDQALRAARAEAEATALAAHRSGGLA